MRISPNGRRLVYIAGKGEIPAAPMVTLRLEDGVEVALASGHDPAFADPDLVYWSAHDDTNVEMAHATNAPIDGGPWAPEQTWMLAGNKLAAGGGVVAVHRTDPRRVLRSDGRVISGATDPAISDDGEWLAYLLPDQPPGLSTLLVERWDREGEPRAMATGALSSPRFGGRTLVWECGAGVIGGCADVGNPHVDPTTFRLPDWKFYKPVPVWVPIGGALLVLLNADRGNDSLVLLAEWSSLDVGVPVGWPLGVSTGAGYEHDARPIEGGPLVRAAWLNPHGVVDEHYIDVRQGRVALWAPRKELPPPVPPDIPWRTDLSKHIPDMLAYLEPACTAIVRRPDGTGDLWLHKSQERDNWGENWDFDRDHIGFVEDRSTGTRMVSMDRPRRHGHTNTTRNRLSPEEIIERNTRGENVGDPWTLPLAGYTWRRDRLWMPRHFTGRFSRTFRTDFVWWDLPQFGGVWEVWRDLPLTIEAEAGYGRFNDHDVFARTRYGKPDGDEWNYWGPHGWIAFIATNADGTENARSIAPPEARGAAKGPFVPARFTPSYPIIRPEKPKEQPAMPMPDLRAIPRDQVVLMLEALDVYLKNNPRLGRGDGLLPRDGTIAERIDTLVAFGINEALGHFQAEGPLPGDALGYAARRHRALDHAVRVIERELGERPPLPVRDFSGPIQTVGRSFVIPE